MAQYRITCTRQVPVNEPTNKAHIVAVGTGTLFGHYDTIWSVDEVVCAIDRGHVFYTHGERSGKRVSVEKYVCATCRRALIRSKPDAVEDNNLDNLPPCG